MFFIRVIFLENKLREIGTDKKLRRMAEGEHDGRTFSRTGITFK